MQDALEKLIRPHFKTLKGYVSAGMESDKTAEKTYLNANENPYEIPGLEELNRYPEPQPRALLEAYAKAYGCAAEQILATRGSDEAIALLSKTFCEPHKDAIAIHPPTFGVYAVNGQTLPVEIKNVPLIEKDGDFHLDKDGLISLVSSPRSATADLNSGDPEKRAAKSGSHMDPVRANPAAPDANGMTSNVKIIYLCSPNNPTGTSFPREDLVEIIKAVEGQSLVVLDEAYIEFAEAESLVPLLADHPNLIILRTMSKAYSLAGARMGVMISGDPAFIRFMQEKVSDIYPIPKPCTAAALTALAYDIGPSIEKILAEKDRMIEALTPHVEHIYPSDTNFLLIKMNGAGAFCAKAKAQGILIRDFSTKLENCLRLTIGTPEENEKVLTLLTGFVQQ